MAVEPVRMNPAGLPGKKKRFALDRMWFTMVDTALLKKSLKTSPEISLSITVYHRLMWPTPRHATTQRQLPLWGDLQTGTRPDSVYHGTAGRAGCPI